MAKAKEWNYFVFAKAAMRRASLRWGPRNEALKTARVARGLYECAMCKNHVRAKDKQLDHIEPVQPLETTSQTLDDFAKRLFCQAENFQLICQHCHLGKTLIENSLRKTYRDEKKEIKKQELKIAKKKKIV